MFPQNFQISLQKMNKLESEWRALLISGDFDGFLVVNLKKSEKRIRLSNAFLTNELKLENG